MTRRRGADKPSPAAASHPSNSNSPAPSLPTLAGLGRRLASLLYEALVVVAILFLGSGFLTAVAGPADSLPARTALQAVLVTLAGGYFVWCWIRSGQTLPMQAWQLQLVDAGTGRPPGLPQALRRYFLALPGVLLGGVSFLWAFLDRDRQFLHDRLAGTRIVQIPRRN